MSAAIAIALDDLPVEILTEIIRYCLESHARRCGMLNNTALRRTCRRLRQLTLPALLETLHIHTRVVLEAFLDYINAEPSIARYVKHLNVQLDHPTGSADRGGAASYAPWWVGAPLNLHLYAHLRSLVLGGLTGEYFDIEVLCKELPTLHLLERVSLSTKGSLLMHSGVRIPLHEVRFGALQAFWTAPGLKSVSLAGFSFTTDPTPLLQLLELEELTFITCAFDDNGAIHAIARSRLCRKLHLQNIQRVALVLLEAFAERIEELTLLYLDFADVTEGQLRVPNWPPESAIGTRVPLLKTLTMGGATFPARSIFRPGPFADGELWVMPPRVGTRHKALVYPPPSVETLRLIVPRWAECVENARNLLKPNHTPNLKTLFIGRRSLDSLDDVLDLQTFTERAEEIRTQDYEIWEVDMFVVQAAMREKACQCWISTAFLSEF